MHLSGSVKDRRCLARVKNQVSMTEKEQNESVLLKGLRRNVAALKALPLKAGFVKSFVHMSSEVLSSLIVNMVSFLPSK